MVKYFLAVVPLIGTTIGAIIGVSKRLSSKFEQQEEILVAVATGILCSISFNLSVEAIENIRNRGLLLGLVIGYIFSIITNLLAHKKNLNTKNKLFWAMLIHNIPEGIIVGISLADKTVIPTTVSLILSVSLQNIPDGLVVAMPLVSTKGKKRALLRGLFSGIVEPVVSILLIITAGRLESIQTYEPFLIGFALVSIIMIAIELLKECQNKKIVFVVAVVTMIFNGVLG